MIMRYILNNNEYESCKTKLVSNGKEFESYTLDSSMTHKLNISFENNDKILINTVHNENCTFVHFDNKFRLIINGNEVVNENRIQFKISSFASGNVLENGSFPYSERNIKPKYFYLSVGKILTISFSDNIMVDKNNIEIIIDTENCI